MLCRFENYSGLVSSDTTQGLRTTAVTQENRRVQMTAIWSDTAMNWGARLHRNTAPLFAGTNTRINAPQCEELACSWPYTQKCDPRWKNSPNLLTAISLEHAFNTTVVASFIVKSDHEIAGCSQSCVRSLLCQRQTHYSKIVKIILKMKFLYTVTQRSLDIRGNTLYIVSRDFCTTLCTGLLST